MHPEQRELLLPFLAVLMATWWYIVSQFKRCYYFMYFRKMENVLGCDSNFILDVVNFSYPLDWVTGCEDICYTLLGGVSVMLFPDEIKIEIGRLSKADGPPQG